MEYKAYKLRFLTGVHFGKGSLDDTSYAFCADTLFSALCIEALKDSEQRLNNFVNTVKSGKLMTMEIHQRKNSIKSYSIFRITVLMIL